MNSLLDIKTIFIALVIGHVFSSVLIGTVWLRNQKDSSINTFFFAKCIQAIAWCFLTFRGGVNDALTAALFNTLIIVGDAMELIAVLKLQNMFNEATKKLYVYLTATNVLGFLLIILFYNEEILRIIFASFGTAALTMIPAYTMLKGITSSILQKLMGYFYLLITVFFLVRALVVLFSNHSMSLYLPGTFQTVFLLVLYLIMMMGNTGFILLLNQRSEQELLLLASYDDLTDTLNRRTFILQAERCLSLYAKKKEPISLLLFDVDHFKQINDTCGHDIGDRVLQNIAAQVRQHLRSEDLFGRFGGDEFAIMLPGVGEREAFEFSERIRKTIAQEGIQETTLSYTLSIGLITVIPDPHLRLNTLYILCDKALYGAKNKGRNCVFQSQDKVVETKHEKKEFF